MSLKRLSSSGLLADIFNNLHTFMRNKSKQDIFVLYIVINHHITLINDITRVISITFTTMNYN